MQRDQELPPSWTEPVPAGFKRYPLLGKADAISGAVITYLRKGKKHCATAVREE